MLTHLHIRHFAIIDTSDIELDAGMTALTGETGAGKSILLGALGLVLGARASSESVQQGAKRADITATFELSDLPLVTSWLKDKELDADNECIVRRTLTSAGKSRASINDIPVSVQCLAELGNQLVAIHGQHAHQTLGKHREQRLLLDRLAGTAPAEKVSAAWQKWKQASATLAEFENDIRAREQRQDLLNFQLAEFDELDIGKLSIHDIESEHQWLANADRIQSLAQEVLTHLDSVATPALAQANKPLDALVSIDKRLCEALDLTESAGIQISEAVQTVQHALGSLEHDNARLNWLDQKLNALTRLAKKHQCDIAALDDVESALREEYQQLLDPANSVEELAAQVAELRTSYDDLAAKLSRHRKKHAKALSATITDAMQGVNMQGGVFTIDIQTTKGEPSESGNDEVNFLVSPNPGVKPAPLGKIASGGELSRISLCLQLATLSKHSVPTLIFDEVDSGVGGAVAETVGKLLRQVGQSAQVLCVTHLPQVAAQAHHHLQVSKSRAKGKTSTSIQALSGKETRDEIARMLGGAKLTRKSQQHAQEMLDVASEQC